MTARFVLVAAFAWLAMMAPGAAAPASATTVLVIGEDAAPDSVPRSSQIHRNVLRHLNDQLAKRGYHVLDDLGATQAPRPEGGVSRTDAEVLEIARSLSGTPADMVVVFTLYSETETLKYSTLLRSRLSGRLLAVESGEHLGSFDVAFPRDRRLPYGCKRNCLLEAASRQAGRLARELGRDIAARMEARDIPRVAGATPQDFTLIVDGFTPEEVDLIVEFLAYFEGYHDARVVSDYGLATTLALQTFSDWPSLKRNFTHLMEHLGLPARVHAFEREIRLERTKVPAR